MAKLYSRFLLVTSPPVDTSSASHNVNTKRAAEVGSVNSEPRTFPITKNGGTNGTPEANVVVTGFHNASAVQKRSSEVDTTATELRSFPVIKNGNPTRGPNGDNAVTNFNPVPAVPNGDTRDRSPGHRGPT